MGVLLKGSLFPTLIVVFGLSGFPVLTGAFLCVCELPHGEFLPISLRSASVRASLFSENGAVSASGSFLAALGAEDVPAAFSLCWAQLAK